MTTLEEKIQTVLLYAKIENIQEVKSLCKNHFATAKPVDKKIGTLVKTFKETGIVHHRGILGRMRSVVAEKVKLHEDTNISI